MFPANEQGLSISYTGTWHYPYAFALAPNQKLQINDALQPTFGKWVVIFDYAESGVVLPGKGLTSLTLSDLAGCTGNFSPNALGSLKKFDAPALHTVLGLLTMSNMASLTTLSFPALKTVRNALTFSNNTLLTTLSFPALKTLGGDFTTSGLSSLTTLNLPALTTLGGTFNPIMSALTTMNLPALVSVGGGNFSPNSMNSLTTLSAPVLENIGGNYSPNNMSSLTTLSVPKLTVIGGSIAPSAMTGLTTISVPAIVVIGSQSSSGNIIGLTGGTGNLTTFTLPATLKQVGNGGGNVVITSAILTQASVDSILVALAALDGTNGTTAFSSRTVTITSGSATPSATGLTAKNTLVARSCTVTHN